MQKKKNKAQRGGEIVKKKKKKKTHTTLQGMRRATGKRSNVAEQRKGKTLNKQGTGMAKKRQNSQNSIGGQPRQSKRYQRGKSGPCSKEKPRSIGEKRFWGLGFFWGRRGGIKGKKHRLEQKGVGPYKPKEGNAKKMLEGEKSPSRKNDSFKKKVRQSGKKKGLAPEI